MTTLLCNHKAELSGLLHELEEAERLAETIKARAKYLTQVGEDFHPWTFANFTEAIENAPAADRMVMFATIAAAVDGGLDNPHSNHMALVAMRQLNENYWMAAAKVEASR